MNWKLVAIAPNRCQASFVRRIAPANIALGTNRQISMVDRCQSLRLRLALGRSSYGSYQHFDFVACRSSQWVRPHILHWWCSKLPNKKRIIPFGMILFLTGSYLSSQAASSQVLSTYKGLTTVFGMGTGGSP